MTPEEIPAEPVKPEGDPYLGFFLGAELYGLPLQRLREVCRISQLRRIPGAASHVAGLVNVRGEIMCALDMRAILGLAPIASSSADHGYLIALRDFDYPVGLVVDAITDIFPIDPTNVDAPPAAWPATRTACFIGMSRVRVGQIGLLDIDRVVKR
jgi:purine-binding chemotaxis protein CheW